MNIFSSKLLCRIEDKQFVRPNLTANGTIGGSNFAVVASSERNSNYSAYKAVDSEATSYWFSSVSTTKITSSNPVWYTFYNPEPLKVSQLVVTSDPATSSEGWKYHYTIKNATLQGSNDNSTWENIVSVSGEGKKADTIFNCPNNNKYFKYHRIFVTEVNPYSPNASYYALTIRNLAITATYEVNE